MFFNPDVVLSEDFLLNFVTSERGAGKTFSTLKYCVEKFISCGEQFVYCRRTDTELEKSSPTLMSQLQVKGFFSQNKISIKKEIIYIDGKVAGFLAAINTAYKLKSVSFLNVKYIIFDEFISENKKYLKCEVEKFLSLIETIARMREVQIICLANESTIYNPYYIYFAVKPAGKVFTRFRQKSILLYKFKSEEYREAKIETKFGKLIKGTTYGNFMLENENIHDDKSFVDRLDGITKFDLINIIIDKKNIAVYEAHVDGQFILFFKQRETVKDKPTVNFDKMLVENATIETLQSHPATKRISTSLKLGKIRFNDMETKQLIENFIF